jgi:hypothetical protein
MKPLSRYIILLSSLACLLLPKKIATACGFGVGPGEYRFWLLQPDLTNTQDLSPFFFATSYLYRDNYVTMKDESIDININEWYEYCNHNAAKKDIRAVLYSPNAELPLLVIRSMKSENSFARFLLQPANKEVLQYVQLCKRTEVVATNPDPWQESSPNNPLIVKIIDQADSLYHQTQSPWLRLRTAFQLLRLHRHNHAKEEAGRIYDNRIAPVKTTSWIATAALYEKAGTMSGPGRDYLYSKVFDKGTYRRTDCLIKFDSRDIRDILPLAKNDHERTVLYAMKAFNDPGKSLTQLKNIYAKEPTYHELAFLLLREINKLEDWLVTNKVTDFAAATREYQWDIDRQAILLNHKDDVVYAKQVFAFIEQIINDNKNKDRALLNLYAAHLALVQEDYTTSRTYLDAAKKYTITAPNIKTQLQVNDLLLYTLTNKEFDTTAQQQLLKILKTPDAQLGVNSPDLLKDQLILFIGQKLIAKGDRVKGLLLLSRTRRALGDLPISAYKTVYQKMQEVATPADYDSILQILNKPVKTPFEKFTTTGRFSSPLDYYSYNEDDWYTLRWDRNELQNCKATWYMQHDNLPAALKAFRQIPDSFWKKDRYSGLLDGDLFFVNVYQSYVADPNEVTAYNKKQAVEAILHLKNKAQKDKTNAAQYYYELGNAYYNMTYHGKYWIMSKPWWSCNEWSEYGAAIQRTPFNDNYFGCNRAKEYYLLALKTTKDKKLAALCCFMAGKCESNSRLYRSLVYKREYHATDNPYVAELTKKTFSTGYYTDLVNECLTYQSFIKQYNRQK